MIHDKVLNSDGSSRDEKSRKKTLDCNKHNHTELRNKVL